MRWSDWTPSIDEDVDITAWEDLPESDDLSDLQIHHPWIAGPPPIFSGSDAERMLALCSRTLPRSLWLLM